MLHWGNPELPQEHAFPRMKQRDDGLRWCPEHGLRADVGHLLFEPQQSRLICSEYSANRAHVHPEMSEGMRVLRDPSGFHCVLLFASGASISGFARRSSFIWVQKAHVLTAFFFCAWSTCLLRSLPHSVAKTRRTFANRVSQACRTLSASWPRTARSPSGRDRRHSDRLTRSCRSRPSPRRTAHQMRSRRSPGFARTVRKASVTDFMVCFAGVVEQRDRSGQGSTVPRSRIHPSKSPAPA